MSLAEVGVRVRALEAQAALSDIRAVHSEITRLGAANTSLQNSNQSSSRTFLQTSASAAALSQQTASLAGATQNLRTEMNYSLQKTREHGDMVDELRRKYMPLYAVSQQYERQLEEISQAEQIGILTTQQATSAREQAAQSLVRVNQTMNMGSRFMRQYGQAATLASFQVQDFAVQMASGQSMMVALSQQLPQLLGSFGAAGKLAMFGAAAGTLVAVGSAVYTFLSQAGEEADSLTDKLSDMNDALSLVEEYDFDTSLDDMEQAAIRIRREFEATLGVVERVSARQLQDSLRRSIQGMGLEDALSEFYADESMIAQIGGDTPDFSALGFEDPERAVQAAQILRDIQGETRAEIARSFEQANMWLRGSGLLTEELEEQLVLFSDSLGLNEVLADETERVSDAMEDANRHAREMAQSILDAYESQRSLSQEAMKSLAGPAMDDPLDWVARRYQSSEDLSDAASGGMRDLIAEAEGTGDNYNTTLGYGQYTGGQRDLVNMTLREILDLQRQMLSHPDNEHNSSALGRYQIIGTTLGGSRFTGDSRDGEGLIGELGLSMDERFTPDLQDRLADQLIRRRRGQGVEGYYNEWEGLRDRGVTQEQLSTAMGNTQLTQYDEQHYSQVEDAASAYLDLRSSQDESVAAMQRFRSAQETVDEALRRGVITEEEASEARTAARQEYEDEISSLDDRHVRRYERILTSVDPVAEAQMKLSSGVREVNEALQAGVISQTEAARTLELLREQYRETMEEIGGDGSTENIERGVREVSSVLAEARNGIDDFGDAFANMLDRIAQKLAQSAIESMITDIFQPQQGGVAGAIFGSIGQAFTSYSGGGYTGDGSRSGGIDGEGGFLMIGHPQETVVDHTVQKSGGGGNPVSVTYSPVNDFRGASVEAVGRIEQALGQLQSDFGDRVIGTIRDAGNTGTIANIMQEG